jgi:hypothetical protein
MGGAEPSVHDRAERRRCYVQATAMLRRCSGQRRHLRPLCVGVWWPFPRIPAHKERFSAVSKRPDQLLDPGPSRPIISSFIDPRHFACPPQLPVSLPYAIAGALFYLTAFSIWHTFPTGTLAMSLISSVFGRVFSRFGGRSTASAPAGMRSSSRSAKKLRKTVVDLEQLEQRMALTVSPVSIRLAPASDTGIRGDGITRLAQPTLIGSAPARSTVSVFADGLPIGTAKASPKGAWSLARPRSPLSLGPHVLTASAALPNRAPISSAPMWMAVDRTPPTATLSFNATLGSLKIEFSERVNISPTQLMSRIRLTIPNVGTFALSSPVVREVVGGITASQLNPTTYTFQLRVTPRAPGMHMVSLMPTGVFDFAGNPLPRQVSAHSNQ